MTRPFFACGPCADFAGAGFGWVVGAVCGAFGWVVAADFDCSVSDGFGCAIFGCATFGCAACGSGALAGAGFACAGCDAGTGGFFIAIGAIFTAPGGTAGASSAPILITRGGSAAAAPAAGAAPACTSWR